MVQEATRLALLYDGKVLIMRYLNIGKSADNV